MLPFVEHAHGIYHTQGGLSEISEAMAKVCREYGVEIRLNSPVKELVLEGRAVKGVELESGEMIHADETVLNADFGYAMEHLVPKGVLKKYRPEKLRNMDFSCSTFMLYLGLDKVYDLPHHTIFFAKNYRQNIEDVFQYKKLSDEISFLRAQCQRDRSQPGSGGSLSGLCAGSSPQPDGRNRLGS